MHEQRTISNARPCIIYKYVNSETAIWLFSEKEASDRIITTTDSRTQGMKHTLSASDGINAKKVWDTNRQTWNRVTMMTQ